MIKEILKNRILLGAILAATLTGAGCQISGRDLGKTGNGNTSIVHLSNTQVPSNGTSGSGSGSSSGSGSTSQDGAPLYEFDISAVGYTSKTVKVKTKDVLRVRFMPGTQNSTVAGSGFAPQYSRLGVYLTVGSNSQQSGLLSNGLAASQQTSNILDFSYAFTKICPSSDEDCRQEVNIKIERPNYDYWCYNYPWGYTGSDGKYYYPCATGYSKVYETHPWNGKVLVETNDTVSFVQ